MRLTVRQLKRIIKEAIQPDEKRLARNTRRREKAASERQRQEEERVSKLNMPPEKEAKLVRVLTDLHFQHGDEGVEMSWDEVEDFARQKGVQTSADELIRVLNYSDDSDIASLGYVINFDDNGIQFDDPMAL